MVQQLSTNTFCVAKFIVSPTLSNGTHTTIAGAMASASSGDTIWVRDGTYTEDVACKAGVTVTAAPSASGVPNVKVIGKWTYASAGTFCVNNIYLQTNSDFILAVTGSAASIVKMDNVYLNCIDNTGISFTTSNSSAQVNLINFGGDIATNGDTFFVNTTTGLMTLNDGVVGNSGNSTTTSSSSAGNLGIGGCTLLFPITITGTGGMSAGNNTTFFCSTINTTALTVGGSANAGCGNCVFLSGTASAINITANTLNLSECSIASTNTNAITGTSPCTLNYSGLAFSLSSSTINSTITQVPQNVGPRIQLGSGTAGAGGSQLMSGTGSPDSTVTAPKGSMYLQVDGGAPWANLNGTTSWVPLGQYVTGAFTPTILGGSTAGTTTYSTQNGIYTRNGDTIWVTAFVACSAATGTGDIRLGGFPFTINGSTFPTAGMYLNSAGLTWPVGRTSIALAGVGGQTYAVISTTGSGVAESRMQMANTAMSFIFGMTYRI